MKPFYMLTSKGAPFSVLFFVDFLIAAARHMKRHELKRLALDFTSLEGEIDEDVTGELRTNFKHHYVAVGMSGILFTATVEHDDKTTEFHFLVGHGAFENGKKSPGQKWRLDYPWRNVQN